MEEDKKKRKNKKKKNKQNAAKHVDGSSVSEQSSAPPVVNHTTEKAKSAADVHQDSRLNLPKEDAHGVTQEGKIQELPLENDISLQKEIAHADLLEKVDELQREKEVHIQQEIAHAGLLEKVDELQKEKVSHIQHQASLQEKISQLEKEKDSYMKKEAALERKITELQTYKQTQVQKENLLEIQIGQLQMEKESWFQKEVLLEKKINHLMGETAALTSVKVALTEKVQQMEKEREAWVSQEKLVKEVAASLNDDNLSLKSQVAELEESRSSLLQKNHLLNKTISDLQSQILSIERTASSSTKIDTHAAENGNLAPQSETANALVERLVKDLSVESQNKNLQQETSFNGNNAGVGVTYDPASMQPEDGAQQKETRSELRVDTIRIDANNNQESHGHFSADNPVVRDVFPDSSKMIESDVIVQIPLDEIERQPVGVDSEPSNDANGAEVALVDAPLIGAPFRLISFFARYVSGADLVEKNSVK